MGTEGDFDSARRRRLVERVTRVKAAGSDSTPRGAKTASFPRWALGGGAETEGSRRRERVMGEPPVCPLERAIGRDAPCALAGCVFYRVPGTRMDCAVEQWAPAVDRDPDVAAWFSGVRGCAERELAS